MGGQAPFQTHPGMSRRNERTWFLKRIKMNKYANDSWCFYPPIIFQIVEVNQFASPSPCRIWSAKSQVLEVIPGQLSAFGSMVKQVSKTSLHCDVLHKITCAFLPEKLDFHRSTCGQGWFTKQMSCHRRSVHIPRVVSHEIPD